MIKGVPIQDYCYMVPNGTYLGSGSRQGKARYMAKLKSMGFKAGVSDIVIACPVPPYAGAYLELKRERGGTLSKAQKSWLRLMYGVGYYVSVCHGLEQATADVISYLHGEPIRSAVKKRLDI